MADISSVGMDAILRSEASSYVMKVNVTSFQLGASAGVTFNPNDISPPGGVVYTGSSSEITAHKVGTDMIMFVIVLPETVGTFSYGNVALMLDTGQMLTYDVFPDPRFKYAKNLPAQPGDVHRLYMPLVITNAASVFNLTLTPTTPADLPIANLVTDLPAAGAAPHSLYIVRSVSAIGGSAGLAYTDGSAWKYSSLGNQTFSSYAQGTQSATPNVTGNDSVALGAGIVVGSNSFALGPGTVNGNRSVSLAGGSTLKGDFSVVSGDGNAVGTTTADYHNFVFGSGNLVEASKTLVVGSDNTVDNVNGTILLGDSGYARNPFEQVMSAGKFTVDGDAQTSRLMYRVATSSTTPTEIKIATLDHLRVPLNSTHYLEGTVVALNTVTHASLGWRIVGKVENFGTVSVVANAILIDAGSTTAGVNFIADTPNEKMKIFVSAATADTTLWVVSLTLTTVRW